MTYLPLFLHRALYFYLFIYFFFGFCFCHIQKPLFMSKVVVTISIVKKWLKSAVVFRPKVLTRSTNLSTFCVISMCVRGTLLMFRSTCWSPRCWIQSNFVIVKLKPLRDWLWQILTSFISKPLLIVKNTALIESEAITDVTVTVTIVCV